MHSQKCRKKREERKLAELAAVMTKVGV